MGIYIYQEANGYPLVFTESESKPQPNITINSVNGSLIPIDRSKFTLIETVAEINAASQWSSKNVQAIKDAIMTSVVDLGGGDMEAGFNLLSEDEKVIAAINDVGTPAQIAAYFPAWASPNYYTIDIIT